MSNRLKYVDGVTTVEYCGKCFTGKIGKPSFIIGEYLYYEPLINKKLMGGRELTTMEESEIIMYIKNFDFTNNTSTDRANVPNDYMFLIRMDEHLTVIEDIFSKYITLPENLVFVKNNRYPLEQYEKRKLGNLDSPTYVSNTPFHPFMCITCVTDILEIKCAYETDYPDLFEANPLLDGKGIEYMSRQRMNSDIYETIARYLTDCELFNRRNTFTRGEFDKDVITIGNVINDIFKILIKPYCDQYRNQLFVFEVSSAHIFMVSKGNITTMRFEEAIKYKENCENIDSCKDVCDDGLQ